SVYAVRQGADADHDVASSPGTAAVTLSGPPTTGPPGSGGGAPGDPGAGALGGGGGSSPESLIVNGAGAVDVSHFAALRPGALPGRPAAAAAAPGGEADPGFNPTLPYGDRPTVAGDDREDGGGSSDPPIPVGTVSGQRAVLTPLAVAAVFLLFGLHLRLLRRR